MPLRGAALIFARRGFSLAALVALAAPLGEQARAEAGQGRSLFSRRQAPVRVAATPAPKPEVRLFADALPTANPAAADQQLTPEGDRQARALTAFAQGQLAEDNADADGALESYRQAFNLDPAHSELAIKLAYLLAQKQDAPGGIQVLKDTIKAAPRQPLPLVYLSQLYAKYLKRNEQALRYAEQALALDPGLYPAILAVYELQVTNGQPARALATLQTAARGKSLDPQYWLQVGELFSRAYLRGNAPPSPHELSQTSSLFRRAAELGTDDALIQAKVGNFFTETKQAREAVPFYLAALRLRGDSEEPLLVGTGDKLARALSESGQRDEALTVLEGMARQNPTRAETFELLGQLYEEKEDLARALPHLQRAQELDGLEARHALRLAHVLLRLKRYPEALEVAQNARGQFADDPQVTYLLALTQSQAGLAGEALATFAQAQSEFRQGHAEYLNASFFFSYGVAAERAGEIERAAELLKKSIELAPDASAEAYNYLGFMWVERGQHLEEAGEMIRRALETQPENGAFLDSYGWYWYQQGDYARAVEQLQKAAARLPAGDAVVLDHLGDAWQALGKVPEALESWRKAQALASEHPGLAAKIEAAQQKLSSAK